MHGLERRRRWTRADGSTATRAYRYYACPSRSGRPSGSVGGSTAGERAAAGEEDEAHPGWRAAALERAVLEAIRAEPAETLRESFRPPIDDLPGDDLRAAEGNFLEAVRNVASGRGNLVGLATPLDELRRTRAMSRPDGAAFSFEDALRSLGAAEPNELHAAIASLVDRVIVRPDRVEPVFRIAPD